MVVQQGNSCSSVQTALCILTALNMTLDGIPKDLRGLRVCKVCSRIKSIEQFLRDGCDNCEPYLKFKRNREAVNECNSQSFDGMISLMSSTESWFAKWQRIEHCVPCVYAVSVSGELSGDIVKGLKDQGKAFFPRDRSTKT